MSIRERAVFAPLIVMTLILGVYPVLALDLIGPSVQTLVEKYNTAVSVAGVSGEIMIAAQ
jgi:NADH-quinone oxidoreductase subunit M